MIVGDIMKDKFKYLWLSGVIFILAGLGIGLKVNRTAGIVLTVVGMLISIVLILLEDKNK